MAVLTEYVVSGISHPSKAAQFKGTFTIPSILLFNVAFLSVVSFFFYNP